jgi:hypothetical protein
MFDSDVYESIDYYRLPYKWRGKIDKETIENFDKLVPNQKVFMTNEFGRFILDLPNRKIYLIFRRYDIFSKQDVIKYLSIFQAICDKKKITFFYEPQLSN